MKNYFSSNHISIFDICGTLFNANTTFEFIVYYHKKKRHPYKYFLSILLTSIVGKLIAKSTGFSIRNVLIGTLAQQKKSDLYSLSYQFYDDKLIHKINAIIFKNFELTSNKLLLSASIDPVVAIIGEKLHVPYFCSELTYINGVSNGKIHTDLKGRKSTMINTPIDMVYTDNFDDIDLIDLSKKSIIVYRNQKKFSIWWNKILVCNNRKAKCHLIKVT
jgi:hypothetical protein